MTLVLRYYLIIIKRFFILHTLKTDNTLKCVYVIECICNTIHSVPPSGLHSFLVASIMFVSMSVMFVLSRGSWRGRCCLQLQPDPSGPLRYRRGREQSDRTTDFIETEIKLDWRTEQQRDVRDILYLTLTQHLKNHACSSTHVCFLQTDNSFMFHLVTDEDGGKQSFLYQMK